MSNAHYTMYGEPEIFVQANSDKEYKYIQVDMKPTKEIEEIGCYFFRMSIPNEVWMDNVNDIQSFLRDIKLIKGDEKLEDALELFVRHQKRPLFKDMFNTAIKELTKNGYIKETKIKTSITGIPISCYDFS